MAAERDKDRRHRRADSLQHYAGQYTRALDALHEVYDGGALARARFAVRRSLILRRRPPEAPTEPPPPSPVAPLVTQKGWALHLYLIAIFEAQSRRRPGRAIQNMRELRGTHQQRGWVDLLPATTATADQATGAMRQTKRALTLLSRANLVKLSGLPGSANRFERFQLLIESGLSHGLWGRDSYYIPNSGPFGNSQDYLRPIAPKAGQTEALLLPSAFFLQGWVHVLSAAEIVTYLMIRDLETRYPQASKNGVYVNEPTRKAWYGISRDVYESHQQLAAYGLIEKLDDPNRGTDGKILHRPGAGQYLQPLRFRTLAHGLDQAARKTVTGALTKN
jgi:hypothetical protein